MIQLKRVYEGAGPEDGERFLVDRLWPRGLRKETAALNGWPKDAAPSHELRKWFHGGGGPWEAFRGRYFKELDANPDGWRSLLAAAREGTVTFLYAAKDPDHNNAAALKEYLEEKLAGK